MKSFLATLIVSIFLIQVPETLAQNELVLTKEVKKHYVLITAQVSPNIKDIAWDLPPALEALPISTTQVIIISPDIGTYHICAAIVSSTIKPLIATLDLTIEGPPPPPDPLEAELLTAYKSEIDSEKINNLATLVAIYAKLTPIPATITTNQQLQIYIHSAIKGFMPDSALKSVRTIIATHMSRTLPGGPIDTFNRDAAEKELKLLANILGKIK